MRSPQTTRRAGVNVPIVLVSLLCAIIVLYQFRQIRLEGFAVSTRLTVLEQGLETVRRDQIQLKTRWETDVKQSSLQTTPGASVEVLYGAKKARRMQRS